MGVHSTYRGARLGFGAKNKICNLARRKMKIILTVVFEIDFWQLEVYEAFSSF